MTISLHFSKSTRDAVTAGAPLDSKKASYECYECFQSISKTFVLCYSSLFREQTYVCQMYSHQ